MGERIPETLGRPPLHRTSVSDQQHLRIDVLQNTRRREPQRGMHAYRSTESKQRRGSHRLRDNEQAALTPVKRDLPPATPTDYRYHFEGAARQTAGHAMQRNPKSVRHSGAIPVVTV
jgi:hypothetical protein